MIELPIRAAWVDEDWPTIVVDVDDEIRRARLLDRGMDDDEIDARIAAQPSAEEWRAGATWLVHNDGGLAELAEEVDGVWRQLVADDV